MTGELTHHAVWLEGELEVAIENYFAVPNDVRTSFQRLVLQREGMTFQNKIDSVRSIIGQGTFDDEYKGAWKTALDGIDKIKKLRNAMAHGKDSGGTGVEMKIATVSRTGKESEIEVNPDSHVKCLADAEKLLTTIKGPAARIRQFRT